MSHRKKNENSAPTTSSSCQRPNPLRRGGRLHKPTKRAQETRDAKAAKEKSLKEKKLKQARRKVLKQRQHESSLTVDRPEDTPEIRELRAALARAQGERNAAEAGAAGTRHRQGPADRSIARPRNMAKTTIRDIRSQLDLTGNKNDQAWADLRADVRRFMDAGMLDLSMGWKEQDNRRLAKVYDAIEDAHPELRRFRAQWATAFLVHESFGAQRTYKNCKGKDGSYRARSREARLTRLERLEYMIIDSDDPIPAPSFLRSNGIGPRAPSHSPNSSPSPPPSQNDNTVHRIRAHRGRVSAPSRDSNNGNRPESYALSLPDLTDED
ncbi:hypothetical protein C8J57DRAFT_1367753 [Mycena rebaudengoi]|nr:hypothetical protein C8J57DRAFT_1367753 [Mycena rebaudengoi]